MLRVRGNDPMPPVLAATPFAAAVSALCISKMICLSSRLIVSCKMVVSSHRGTPNEKVPLMLGHQDRIRISLELNQSSWLLGLTWSHKAVANWRAVYFRGC